MVAPTQTVVTVDLLDSTGQPVTGVGHATASFTKGTTTAALTAFPTSGVTINPTPQSVASDVSWAVSTGIPMPRGALRSTAGLELYENDLRVPAQFTSRATWTNGGDIKWLGMDFIARYDGTTPRTYRLLAPPRWSAPRRRGKRRHGRRARRSSTGRRSRSPGARLVGSRGRI